MFQIKFGIFGLAAEGFKSNSGLAYIFGFRRVYNSDTLTQIHSVAITSVFRGGGAGIVSWLLVWFGMISVA